MRSPLLLVVSLLGALLASSCRGQTQIPFSVSLLPDQSFTTLNTSSYINCGGILSANVATPVTRSLISKLEDTISIRDYGAKCDGVTDDTTAIQTALNAVAGKQGQLTIPGSIGTVTRCLVTSALTIPSNITLTGAGQYSSLIITPDNYAGTVFTSNSSANLQFVTLRDFGIVVNDYNQNATLIHFYKPSWSQLVRLVLSGGLYGIILDGLDGFGATGSIEDCLVTKFSGTGIWFTGNAVINQINNWTVRGGYVFCSSRAPSTATGLLISVGASNTVVGSYIENCGTCLSMQSASGASNRFLSVGTEACTTAVSVCYGCTATFFDVTGITKTAMGTTIPPNGAVAVVQGNAIFGDLDRAYLQSGEYIRSSYGNTLRPMIGLDSSTPPNTQIYTGASFVSNTYLRITNTISGGDIATFSTSNNVVTANGATAAAVSVPNGGVLAAGVIETTSSSATSAIYAPNGGATFGGKVQLLGAASVYTALYMHTPILFCNADSSCNANLYYASSSLIQSDGSMLHAGYSSASAYGGTTTTSTFTLGGATVVGTGASATCLSGSQCDGSGGVINFATGTGVSTTGDFVTVTFSKNNVPACVTWMQRQSGTSTFTTYVQTTATTGLTLTTTGALASSAFYYIHYICMGI